MSTCIMYIFDRSVSVSRKEIRGDVDGRGVNGDGGCAWSCCFCCFGSGLG